jgi:hypothetical protein
MASALGVVASPRCSRSLFTDPRRTLYIQVPGRRVQNRRVRTCTHLRVHLCGCKLACLVLLCTPLRARTDTHTHTHTHTHTCACTQARMPPYTCACSRMRTCTHMCVFTHAHVHTRVTQRTHCQVTAGHIRTYKIVLCDPAWIHAEFVSACPV